MDLTPDLILPDDKAAGLLIGRAWLPGPPAGPSPVILDGDLVRDLSGLAPTTSALFEMESLTERIHAALADESLPAIGMLDALLDNSAWDKRVEGAPWLLAPSDLQSLRASGVTFVDSMLERVIEEQAKGDPQQAEAIRDSIAQEIGTELASLKPGSPEAARLKATLIERGQWSQYLEVGIGPDAEIFTKSQPMSAVGTGAEIGILANSVWNNPEPEVAVVVNSRGEIVGATLANDVNLRDVEGRSALLLGRAKDNNASASLGPFIRLLDQTFTMEEIRNADLSLEVTGTDGYVLSGSSTMRVISRDPEDLARQMFDCHQYPDGAVLYTGTLFAPTEDRDENRPGEGFTHKLGDRVIIRSKELGALVNRVNHCDKIAPWTFGSTALMRNLAARGLL